MRSVLLVLISALSFASARAELYIQSESRSPNGAVVFALNYPPTGEHDTRNAQGCFMHAASKKRIGDFFHIPGTLGEFHRPGTYWFDNYNVFDYIWSSDSTHIAIVHNMRHFGAIHPFRRRGKSFQQLQMPEMEELLHERMPGNLPKSIHISVDAHRWTRKHRLIATIAQEGEVPGSADKAWKEHTLQFTIRFDPEGQSVIEGAKLSITEIP